MNYYAESEILFEVMRDSFMPSPKVDSVVIRLKVRSHQPFDIKDKRKFFTTVRCAFSQRRKTALNSISNTMGIAKSDAAAVFDSLGIEQNIRAEKLCMEDFVKISELI